MNPSRFRIPVNKLSASFSTHGYSLRLVSSLLFLIPVAATSPWLEPSFVPPRRLYSRSNMPLGVNNDFSPVPVQMAKLDSPSAQRNKNPIWQVLSEKVFASAPDRPLRILQIAEGSGVHVDYFATQLAAEKSQVTASSSRMFEWYPTDCDAESRASIAVYIDDGKLDELGVQAPLPLTLDATGIVESSTVAALAGGPLDLILCINMIHISPWTACLGLMKVAGEQLAETGVLYCYGPYKEGGIAVESNLAFDQSLQSRNPEWGVRDLEEVCQAASDQGLELVEKLAMPANNLSLIFRKKKE